MVSYQGIPSGTVSGTVQKEPTTIFRLQQQLVLGKFIKWSSNAGEALAQCVRCIKRAPWSEEPARLCHVLTWYLSWL